MGSVLGLDISTSIVGVCIMGLDEEVREIDFIDLRKVNNFFEKADKVKAALAKLFCKHKVSEVWIEDYAVRYSPGKSKASTITKLASFNGIVSYIVFSEHDFEPKKVQVTSARKNVGLKIPRGSNTKQLVLDFVKRKLPNHDWKRTRFDNDQQYEFDKADAFVIALHGVKSANNVREN